MGKQKFNTQVQYDKLRNFEYYW